MIPPNQSLSMLDGHLSLSNMTRIEERRAPVDIFFRTLAESRHARAVSVILSGTGANGSMGMKRVKELGGVCFAQDPDEADTATCRATRFFTALVDQMLPVAEIPARIIAYKDSLRIVHIPEEPIRRARRTARRCATSSCSSEAAPGTTSPTTSTRPSCGGSPDEWAFTTSRTSRATPSSCASTRRKARRCSKIS